MRLSCACLLPLPSGSTRPATLQTRCHVQVKCNSPPNCLILLICATHVHVQNTGNSPAKVTAFFVTGQKLSLFGFIHVQLRQILRDQNITPEQSQLVRPGTCTPAAVTNRSHSHLQIPCPCKIRAKNQEHASYVPKLPELDFMQDPCHPPAHARIMPRAPRVRRYGNCTPARSVPTLTRTRCKIHAHARSVPIL
jgi:hypothetical protein